jgi:hypothetical protein
MAITACHVRLYKELHAAGLLPQGGPILEIGEANWYGDVDPREVFGNDCTGFQCKGDMSFTIAKQFYKAMFGVDETTAIDMHGTEKALRLDLNRYHNFNNDLVAEPSFNVVINNGTAEHIFNIANVFEQMHDLCQVGGLMFHDVPFTGWVDHGFYNLNPTLFMDVAAANNYTILRMALGTIGETKSFKWIDRREDIYGPAERGELPNNALLLVVFSKTTDAPFRIPMQGYYDAKLSAKCREAWHTLR